MTTDFEIKDGTLIRYHGFEAKVCVPDGVSCIGEGAFTRFVQRRRSHVVTENVYEGPASLPPMLRHPDEVYIDGPTRRETIIETIEEVQEGCDFLLWVTLPEGVEKIGRRAFYDCRNLAHVELPQSLRCIETDAFKDCPYLKQIVLPEQTALMPHAFEPHTQLIREGRRANPDFDIKDGVLLRYLGHAEHVTVPDGVCVIGRNAFAQPVFDDGRIIMKGFACIREVTLPKAVKEIREGAFQRCENLVHVRFSEELAAIGADAFFACASLQSVSLPSKVETIGRYAFTGCAELESLSLPDGLRWIGYDAFSSCKKLTKVHLPANVRIERLSAFDRSVALTRAPAKEG